MAWNMSQDLWSRGQRERELTETQSQRFTEQTARSLGVGRNEPDLAGDWERMRQEIVAQLNPSPRDWISGWKENTQNLRR